MSVHVVITSYSDPPEEFLVEITDDLRIVFLDRDIEYDLALCEFGEKLESCALHNDWYDVPLEIITLKMGLDDVFITRLAMDWAKHVIPVFRSKFPIRDSKVCKDSIDNMNEAFDAVSKAIRLYNKRTFEYSFNELLWDSKDDQDSIFYGKDPPADIQKVREGVIVARYSLSGSIVLINNLLNNTRSALSEIIRAVKFSVSNCTWRAGNFAAHAMGMMVSNAPESEKFKAAERAEQEWQIRRFMDVYNACVVEGLDWPPLESTR